MRNSSVKRAFLYLISGSIVLAGCGGNDGGGNNAGIGQVSGVVFDAAGNPVRNANVYFSYGYASNTISTVTNSNGAYVLKGLPADYDLIQCQTIQGGVTYQGQNLALLNNGQRTMTINLSLYPASSIASMSGTVSDSLGRLLYGAKVFAIPATGPALTSAYGVTDNTGHYFIGGLVAGSPYNIQVNALGYNSAFDKQTLSAGQNLSLSYTIPYATNTVLPTPTNVQAIAYTAPAESTTRPKLKAAVEAVKNLIDPSRRNRILAQRSLKRFAKPGTTSACSQVEVDVLWNPLSSTSLLGYGVYRSSANAPLVNVDFFGDPQASTYEDMGNFLSPGTTYNYAISTISTGYTGTTGESALSSVVSVTPLGTLGIPSVAASTNPTFTWSPATGASSYVLYLFNQYPGLGIKDVYDNYANPTNSTTLTYAGTPLASGQTYYCLLVGFSPSGSETLSGVSQFTVP